MIIITLKFPLEPIGMFLIGMHEVFDENYWQAFSSYVDSGICPADWKDGLPQVKANLETALRGYSAWKGAHLASGFITFCSLRIWNILKTNIDTMQCVKLSKV